MEHKIASVAEQHPVVRVVPTEGLQKNLESRQGVVEEVKVDVDGQEQGE